MHQQKKNAFYNPQTNLLTVCAGLFNGLSAKLNLYAIIVHELSHSIDTESYILDEYLKCPVGKAVPKLSSSSAPPYSCREWKALRKKHLNLSKEPLESVHFFSTLIDCLTPLNEHPTTHL